MTPDQPVPEFPETSTLFVFTPVPGTTWNLTLDAFTQALRRREGEEAFVHTKADGGAYGPSDENDWWFDFTVAGTTFEGIGSGVSGDEGLSLRNATAGVAAEFAAWMVQELVPANGRVDFNTRAGMEAGLTDEVLTERTATGFEAVFRDHLGDL
ncbi:hypothetical protein [Streptomyces sp. CBMA156]|uniref:hypothetical protein n=1 Tax=Streptomyces sp. CBMA156 TaxID=1930280 RepID=UPI001661FCC1|nr:hypothetical protein [Streptomyces sp. CBMA156]MBD0675474.1 hypothetical protein [Streptomyces sp. CBMA156]